MKIFKLAKAELKKIFLRPIMFVVFLAMLVALALLTISFNPQPKTTTAITLSRNGQIQGAYDSFRAETSDISKKKFDDVLINEYTLLKTFLDNLDTSEETGQIALLKNKIGEVDDAIDDINAPYTAYFNNRYLPERNAVVDAFQKVYNDITNVLAYLQSLENSLNFFIKESDLTQIKDFFINMQNGIPSTFAFSENDIELFEATQKYLKKFDFLQVMKIVNSLEYFEIDMESFDATIKAYYTDILDAENPNNILPTLNALLAEITEFKQQNAESDEEEHFMQLELMFSQYKSISIMAATVLKNEFTLAKAGQRPDEEMRNYIGFKNYSSYALRQDSNLYKYLLEKNLFDYNFLTPFSFNLNSGQQTNAFDFMVYSMQVISFIIALFAIFIASGTVANEQNNGTMKMLAIRPYSRSKIITAKLLSALYFMFIMLIISFVSTFVIGYFSYGITELQALLVFNAENVFILNAFSVLGLYFASLFLNITFYIVMALLLSVWAKSSTVSIVISTLLYGLSLIGNLLFFNTTWFVYLPIAHLDIFRFFGSQANTGNLFGFTFPLNSNFFVSLIYLASTLLIAYLSTISIFKKRNIA